MYEEAKEANTKNEGIYTFHPENNAQGDHASREKMNPQKETQEKENYTGSKDTKNKLL